jgi:hypothetical protein
VDAALLKIELEGCSNSSRDMVGRIKYRPPSVVRMVIELSRLSGKTFCDCEPQFDDELVTLLSKVGKPPRLLLRQKPRIAKNRVICEDAD